MSCQHAEEIDLMAFAADRRAQEWHAFRNHYPTCPECSHAVAELSRFEARLRDAAADSGTGHVSEDEMRALSEGTLTRVALARVEAHLEGCATCRTEATVLRAFDLAPALEPVRESVTRSAAAESGDGWLASLREILAGIFQPGPTFGLAFAAALAILLFFLFRDVEGDLETPRYVEQTAPKGNQENPAPTPQTDPLREPGLLDEPDSLIAEEPTPSPREVGGALGPPRRDPLPAPDEGIEVVELDPIPPAIDRPPSAPETLAENPAEREPRAPDAQDAAEHDGEREVVLLAALFPSDLPGYAPPTGAGFEGLEPMRIGGTLRSADAPDVHISVLAPEHLGATSQASPRLYWVLDRATPLSIEVVVSDPMASEPLLGETLAGPFSAGMHAIDLGRERVVLREGVNYDWSVALVTSGSGHERDIVSMGGIRRVIGPSQPDNSSASDVQAREVHRLAAAGYWYDALDRVNRWLEQMPGDERLWAYREALLLQVGLESLATYIKSEK